jgi:protein farnesyltransferase subunit beta
MDSWGIDFSSVKRWLVYRQMTMEGGFSGRTNKLVDGCYSFWLGASIAIVNTIDNLWEKSNGTNVGIVYDAGIRYQHVFWMTPNYQDRFMTDSHGDEDSLLFDRTLLQRYILLCGQDLNGGLRDKPSKPRDFYHSCYVLSGLSVSEHVLTSSVEPSPVFGDREWNWIFPTHPVYNIRLERVERVVERFERISKGCH